MRIMRSVVSPVLLLFFLRQHFLWRMLASPMYSIKIGSHGTDMTIESIAVILHVCTVAHIGLIICISDRTRVHQNVWVGQLIFVVCRCGFMMTLPITAHIGLASTDMQCNNTALCCSASYHLQALYTDITVWVHPSQPLKIWHGALLI